ncbi:hypothetical protein [Neisseria weixii]|uniref:hypothetical protein n=1 Tax=Neisseria weixii TaxID=1853276 RepID=UPI001F37B266|nr:hypothetical protein [Neisseria weixii]
MVSEISQHTDRIKAGAVGVMLSNHAPVPACEQYGTGHSMPRSRRNWLGADKGVRILSPHGLYAGRRTTMNKMLLIFRAILG